MRKSVKKILEIFAPFKRQFAIVFSFIAVSQIFALVSPLLQGKVIDCVISGKPLESTLWYLGVAFIVYAIVNVALPYISELYTVRYFDFELPAHALHQTMTKTMSFSIGQHLNQNSGLKQSIMERGEHSLTTFVYLLIYEVVPIALESMLVIAALLYLSLPLGCTVLVAIALYVGSMLHLNARFGDRLKTLEDCLNENARFQSELVRNVGLVLTHAQEKRAVRESGESVNRAYDLGKKLWLDYAHLSTTRNAVMAIGRFAVMGLGLYYVYQGAFTPGYLVVFWSWSSQAFAQLTRVGSIQRQIMRLMKSLSKYFAMLEMQSDVEMLPNPVRPEKFKGRIEFKGATLLYKTRTYLKGSEVVEAPQVAARPALEQISFVIDPGETAAFVGESGAGKSSVVYALLRAQDLDEGQILVDGHDLRLLDLEHYRRVIGLVEQHVPLFDHTLRYNITFGLNGWSEMVTEEELRKIAESACIDRFFHRLEKGFDTLIGERGVKLSGGERQRVGIARALIKEPSILIFDEATSNLDAENEALIRTAIEKASHGRTTIIIAHRLSTIQKVDKVIVMQEGHIVGVGTHQELSRSCEEYRRLIRHQISM